MKETIFYILVALAFTAFCAFSVWWNWHIWRLEHPTTPAWVYIFAK